MHVYYLDKLIEFGMEINEVDVAPFVAATRPVHDMFVGDLVAQEKYDAVIALLEDFRN